jgi:hypothetical protein
MTEQLPLFDPEVLKLKLIDAMTPGFEVEFDPHEADAAGAFREDALSEEDAADSCTDSSEPRS